MTEANGNTILPYNTNQQGSSKGYVSKKLGTPVVYKSPAMHQLFTMVDRVSNSKANVLILGESGTGKELIARTIHDKSDRKDKPFIAINCGALRESLLESELFGHEKGAFTGAYQKKIGLAETAHDGTLFLDEIGELSQGMQAKLLRFIQEGEIYRVGGKIPVKVNIRLVSATNRNIDFEVDNNNFREDLFYRINTITLSVPPLRKRRDDIPLLVNHFLNKSKYKHLNRGCDISPEAMEILCKYDWPGNVRELQNICERLQILSEGHTVMPTDLPQSILYPDQRTVTEDYDPAITVHELEKRYILSSLKYYDGNKTRAANALGITIKTLYNKLHEYGEFSNYAVHHRTKNV